MGGFGSGRWQQGKETTDDYQSLDIRELQRNQYLKPGHEFNWVNQYKNRITEIIKMRVEINIVTLIYQHKSDNNEWNKINYSIDLDRTSGNYGSRAWFLCPRPGCGKRVAILYAGHVFACRHCRNLAYLSARENETDRAARRANKYRKKLGWKEGILNETGVKPKGMHWETFCRLSFLHNKYAYLVLCDLKKKIGMK